jgi:Uma2 family endonuclease
MPRPLPIPLTYEDYLGFPDDGRRHEILEGEHVMTPAPTPTHQAVVVNLTRLLANFLAERGGGRMWTAPIDVIFSPTDVLQPDLCLVQASRLGIVTGRAIEGAPDLVVEVLSPATRQRDEVGKRHLYAKFGVSEYWLIDPQARSVRRMVWSDAGYRSEDEATYRLEERLLTPLLPGLVLDLGELFRDVVAGRS